MDGRTSGVITRGKLCNHCLLIETNDGLVLVDTGFGLDDVANPRTRLSKFFLSLLSPDFREDMTAVRQVERMGFRAQEVRHIVLTHLDFDHAGGLDDFPHARVHMLQQERDIALAQKTWLDRQRFRPQQWQGTQQNWTVYPGSAGEPWYGFAAVRRLEGLPPEILWCPCPATRWAMPAWPCATTAAGCCTPAMRTSTAAKWTPRARIARRACACTRRSWSRTGARAWTTSGACANCAAAMATRCA
jgi:hypothetical protein